MPKSFWTTLFLTTLTILLYYAHPYVIKSCVDEVKYACYNHTHDAITVPFATEQETPLYFPAVVLGNCVLNDSAVSYAQRLNLFSRINRAPDVLEGPFVFDLLYGMDDYEKALRNARGLVRIMRTATPVEGAIEMWMNPLPTGFSLVHAPWTIETEPSGFRFVKARWTIEMEILYNVFVMCALLVAVAGVVEFIRLCSYAMVYAAGRNSNQ